MTNTTKPAIKPAIAALLAVGVLGASAVFAQTATSEPSQESMMQNQRGAMMQGQGMQGGMMQGDMRAMMAQMQEMMANCNQMMSTMQSHMQQHQGADPQSSDLQD